MKTILNEIYEYLNTNDNTKEMYLIQWFEINKIKLLEAEKEQIENSYNAGWIDFENKTKRNKYFGNNYYNDNFKN